MPFYLFYRNCAFTEMQRRRKSTRIFLLYLDPISIYQLKALNKIYTLQKNSLRSIGNCQRNSLYKNRELEAKNGLKLSQSEGRFHKIAFILTNQRAAFITMFGSAICGLCHFYIHFLVNSEAFLDRFLRNSPLENKD